MRAAVAYVSVIRGRATVLRRLPDRVLLPSQLAARPAKSMSVTVAVDAMGGDHGPAVTVPACVEFLEAAPEASVVLVGMPRAARRRRWPRRARPCAAHLDPCGDRSRRHGRAAGGRAAQEEGLVDARRDQPRQGRDRECMRFRGQHRRADGDRAVRAENAAGHRPSCDRVATADEDRRHARAGPRRQRQLHVRAARAIRGDGQRARLGRQRHRAADRRACSTSAKRTSRAATSSRRRPSCSRRRRSTSSATSKATTSIAGTTDVVVCDGFVGNVMLKTSEGLAHMLYEFLKTEFTRNLLTRIAAAVVYPVLMSFKRRIDPRRYNGATLVGLKGVVVKSHGGADAFAFANALQARCGRGRARRAGEDRPANLRNASDAARRTTTSGPAACPCIAASPAPARYLPERIVTNDALADRVATSDEWIRSRTGIRAAAHCRRRRADVGPGAGRGAQRAGRGIARPGRRRPDRRRDDDARHHLSVHGEHPAGEARRGGRTCVRRAGRVLRLRLCAGDRRPDGRRRHCAQRARRRRRSVFADPRLERPRHVRAVRRRCGRGGARALRRSRASCRRICIPTDATRTSCAYRAR